MFVGAMLWLRFRFNLKFAWLFFQVSSTIKIMQVNDNVFGSTVLGMVKVFAWSTGTWLVNKRVI